MATDPLKLLNGFVVYIPPNAVNVIQPAQVMPGAVLPCVFQYGNQQPDRPSDPAQSNPRMRLLEKFLKAETKTLGAVQIMIGLLLIGFGTLPVLIASTYYVSVVSLGGYPFWGGILFIVSGSLAVSSQKHANTNLVKCSLGFTTASAVTASFGIIFYIIELARNPMPSYGNPSFGLALGTGLTILLFLFSLLEFGITVLSAHVGCQTHCCSNEPGIVYIPCTSAGEGTPHEYSPSSPVCGTELQSAVPSAPIYESVPQPMEALK